MSSVLASKHFPSFQRKLESRPEPDPSFRWSDDEVDMPKVDLEPIAPSNATGYPDPFHKEVQGRWWKRIAPLAGLTELGASHVTLDPGAWSSQRHWHETEDELVVMLAGTAVLVEDDGETE